VRSERAYRGWDATYDAKRRQHPDYHFWKSREWRDRLQPAQLRRQPLCQDCHDRGATTPATQVDHVVRPMGNYDLQRDPNNYRSLCASCHSRKTRTVIRGYSKDVDADGYPIDPAHPNHPDKPPGHYPPKKRKA
jgi:5-methylcytosine-specific restriction enzyme A